MARRESALTQEVTDRSRKLEETQSICHRGAVPPNSLGHLLLRELEFLDQALIAGSLFEYGELRPLEILHQRHHQHRSIIERSDQGRDLRPTQALNSPPTALPGHELPSAPSIIRLHGTNYYRL
jgi:hypothetical protein